MLFSNSLSTTSSLLFKDTKPILTYLLGQPKKHGGISSPAQLLSPDRYEFFTFDDDGQIVKKLMSVKEIQKIIANNEKGTGEEQGGTPIEYYQILTVTPDVESIPSVSRINPNEPLFSIHDVIASVQNVLKSEINYKNSQSKTNYNVDDNSEHFSKTEKSPTSNAAEKESLTSVSTSTEISNNGDRSETEILNFRSRSTTVGEVAPEEIEVTTALPVVTQKQEMVLSETVKPLPLAVSVASKESVTLSPSSSIYTSASEPPSTFFSAQDETTSFSTSVPSEFKSTNLPLSPMKLISTVTNYPSSVKPISSVASSSIKPVSFETNFPSSVQPVPTAANFPSSVQPNPVATNFPSSVQPISTVTNSPSSFKLISTVTNFPSSVLPLSTVRNSPSTVNPMSTSVTNSPSSQNTFSLVTNHPSSLKSFAAETTAKPFYSESSPSSAVTFLSSSVSNFNPTTYPSSPTDSSFFQSTTTSKLELAPASLHDAHPGYTSNETFMEVQPTLVETNWGLANTSASVENKNLTFVKVETIDKNSTTGTETTNTPKSENLFTPAEQVSFTPDLANSVSSVLWQIASENAMLDDANKATEPTIIYTTNQKKPYETSEVNNNAEHKPLFYSVASDMTESTSAPTVKISENPFTLLESILRPQNKPRPFQVMSTTEKRSTDPDNLFSTVSPLTEAKLQTQPSSVVIVTEPEETTFKVEEQNYNNQSSSQSGEISTSTTTPFVVSVSPNVVTQSPEHLKPVTDQVKVHLNQTKTGNDTQQTIEGVTIVQEANIGKIPRTTEFPGQVVKEILRKDSPDFILMDDDSLEHSEGNIVTTQVPYVGTSTQILKEKPEPTSQSTSTPAQSTVFENTNPTAATTTFQNTDKDGETAATEKVSITFVPMMIKTPFEFKQEEILNKSGNLTFEQEKLTTTETTKDTTIGLTETPIPEEGLESKELPEDEAELKSILPLIASSSEYKATVLSGNQKIGSDKKDVAGSLKQSVPPKPTFGKPQKPVFKPIKPKPIVKESETKKPYENHLLSSPSVLELEAAPVENLGLEATVVHLDNDVKQFSDLCNELAFSLWSSITHNGLSFVRSIVLSPFAVTSLLAMVFLGARGPTSGQMNDILRLDDMVTFNPHLVFRNVTESLVISRNPGVATAAFVRELYSDKVTSVLNLIYFSYQVHLWKVH